MDTIFKGKAITREMILQAMQYFDENFPDTAKFDNWLEKKTYVYAVTHGGRRYPPKYILSQASGFSTDKFSGGEQTNNVFKALGFVVEFK